MHRPVFIRVMRSTAQAGDLYVYLNGRLCGSSLTGIHPSTSMTLNPSTCASTAGMVSSPATNYKVDIFYAHRSSATTPSVRSALRTTTTTTTTTTIACSN